MPEGRVWHVAVSGVGLERKAEQALIEAGFVAYCPLERMTLGRGPARRDAERPLFSRYVFFSGAGTLAGLREVREVLCGAGGSWVPVPDGVIAGLMRAEGMGVFDRSEARRAAQRRARVAGMKPGDRLRVIGGALAGQIARLVALKPDQRAECLMKIFGTETRVVVALDDLCEVA